MSKNPILPKKKKAELVNVDNIEDLIIQKMEKQIIAPDTEGVGEEEEDIENPQRVNFMMPRYLYDMMKSRLKRKGDKMSNYLITLVRKDLGDD